VIDELRALACDCPTAPYHRWNCLTTPAWAATIRETDCNPWTVFRLMAIVERLDAR